MAEFDILVNAGSTEVDAFLRSLNVNPGSLTGEASSETRPERQQNRESTQDGSTVPSGRTDGVGSEGLLLQAIERISSEMSAMKAQMASLTSRVDGREARLKNVPSPSEQGTELQARNATSEQVRNSNQEQTAPASNSWADRDPEEPLGELGPVSFLEDWDDTPTGVEVGDPDKARIVPVSENTATF